MGKKGVVIGMIFSILALVFTIAYFVNSYQITQENLQQDRQNLVQAEANLDTVVNTAVVHCQQNPGGACNIIMKQWQEACQGDEYKDIKSGHDGKIEAYFKSVDQSSGTSIPQTNLDVQTNASASN
ncbi:MAG: hypothetical protein KGI08_08215, partial [Thaumarchaeota archaeon]|nr:hypothetical protein [Nitrososphaerota archaeon]